MKLYHGTQIQNIKKLEPVATRDNAITKPVICFTPNSCIALFYIWNRSYKWVTFSEKENGKVVFTEHYKNRLSMYFAVYFAQRTSQMLEKFSALFLRIMGAMDAELRRKNRCKCLVRRE